VFQKKSVELQPEPFTKLRKDYFTQKFQLVIHINACIYLDTSFLKKVTKFLCQSVPIKYKPPGGFKTPGGRATFSLLKPLPISFTGIKT